MSQKIFGLTGFAKSGKSTVAEIFKDFGAKEISFANHLKNTCSKTFNIDRIDFDSQDLKEIPFKKPIVFTESHLESVVGLFEVEVAFDGQFDHLIGTKLLTPRHVAQFVGTDILRAIDKNIHITTTMNQIAQKTGIFVVSDVRFPNEFDAIHDSGGTVIGIKRDSVAPKAANLHESESFVPVLIEKSDVRLLNNKDLEGFKKLTRETLWKLVFPGSP